MRVSCQITYHDRRNLLMHIDACTARPHGFEIIKALFLTPKDDSLTHFPLDKMAAIFADDIFTCLFMNENCCISIRISLIFFFLRVQLTISRHWFRYWLGTWTNVDPAHRHIYAALARDDLTNFSVLDMEIRAWFSGTTIINIALSISRNRGLDKTATFYRRH